MARKLTLDFLKTETASGSALALAAIAVSQGQAKDALVTGAGHWRGEGVARLVQA